MWTSSFEVQLRPGCLAQSFVQTVGQPQFVGGRSRVRGKASGPHFRPARIGSLQRTRWYGQPDGPPWTTDGAVPKSWLANRLQYDARQVHCEVPMRSLATTLCVLALSACARKIEGPTPTVSGARSERDQSTAPAYLCNTQGDPTDGWLTEVLGDNFA